MESTHNKMAVGNLMSPPQQQPYENFDKKLTSPITPQTKPVFAAQPGWPSPPISPEQRNVLLAAQHQVNGDAKDPILYPQSEASSTSEPPLFLEPASSIISSDVAATVDQHMSARARQKYDWKQANRTQPPPPLPRREEYVLAAEFKACMMERLQRNPAKYLNRERQLLKDQDRARNAASKKLPSHSTPKKTVWPKLAPSPAGVQKVRAPPKPAVRTPKPKPRRERTSATPDIGSGRSRNTGTSTREDKDWKALRDRCPPIESLEARMRETGDKAPLYTDWKGNSLDLSNDANQHLLHDLELELASKLRLDCATYLTSKRRIFIARYECFKGTWGGAAKGKKEFRKTDAQQACKIDVNKASKLWVSFQRAGWFEEKWVKQQTD